MNNTTAIVAIAFGSLIAVVAVTVLRPNADNTVLYGLIFAAAVPTTASLLSLIKSGQNSADLAETKTAVAGTDAKVQNLAITVDGRLTQLLSVTEGKALAEGAAQGVQAERDRAASLVEKPPLSTPKPGDQH